RSARRLRCPISPGRVILKGTATQIAIHSRDGETPSISAEIGYTSSLLGGEPAMRTGWSALPAWLTTTLIAVSAPNTGTQRDPSDVVFGDVRVFDGERVLPSATG